MGKYDAFKEKLFEMIPSPSDIQQNYKPYLEHIVTQINEENHWTFGMTNESIRRVVFNKLALFMSKPILNGPIKSLSMHKKDLLVFGYIHAFMNQNDFYSTVIPWDVIKLIHTFFDHINKEYLDKFANIKQNIIEKEAEIYDLKHTETLVSYNMIHQKQSELLSLYNQSKDISFQEEYVPHLIDEYIINKKKYQMTAMDFFSSIEAMKLTSFEAVWTSNINNNYWASSINYKTVLFELLVNITPVKIKNKGHIERQFIIYDDYIRLAIGYAIPSLNESKQRIPKLLRQIFEKDNAWSKRVKKIADSMNKNEIIYGTKSKRAVRSTKTGNSFTVD